MTGHGDRSGPQHREAWTSMIEDTLFEADDDEILTSLELRKLAQSARGVARLAIEAARELRPAPLKMRRRPRRAVSRLAPRRAMVRDLLVANPRARDLVGNARVDALSEEELETMIARFAKLGLLPDSED